MTVPAGQVWCFDPGVSTTVQTRANVVVEGTLRMRPSSSSVHHTLRFVDVDESRFVGGDVSEPVASDVGLWIDDAGVWDAQGTPKTSWTRAVGGLPAGASRVDVQDATGWRPGDRIAIVPTLPPTDTRYLSYDERAVTAVSGNSVTVDAPLSHDHPAVTVAPGVVYTAEVLNLTRNVKVEGTPARLAACNRWVGRAHIWVQTSRPQTVRHVELAHLGPRQTIGQYEYLCRGSSKGVPGRNGLHFHKLGDAARGTLIEGVAAHHIGNTAFAPHSSTGITLRANVAHDVMASAYFWAGGTDPGTASDATHELTYDRNVASLVRADELAVNEHTTLAGFELGRGGPPHFPQYARSVAKGNVAVGVQGGSRASGYIWPENGEGVWTFEDNLTHNAREHGLFVWHVTNHFHDVVRFTGYHNGRHGIFHGAYGNPYRYVDNVLYGNRASQGLWWGPAYCDAERNPECPTSPLLIERGRFDGAGISPHALILAGRAIPQQDSLIGRIEGATFLGYTDRAIRLTFDFHDFGPSATHWRLTGNTYGAAGASDDFRCTDDIHERAGLRSDDHALSLRRADQPGTYRPEWNCSAN
ncbi:MAG TPA: hypothetical protein VHF25_07705 [Nitriliruptorales bacterium]|nr:hypothetical protein [Nitriliruptorales bacterium]